MDPVHDLDGTQKLLEQDRQPTNFTTNLCTLTLILEKKVVQKPYYFFCQIGQELFEYQHPMVQIRAPAPYHCKNYDLVHDLVHDLDGTQ